MAEERISYGEISNSCNNLTNLASSMSTTSDNIQAAINQITDPTWDGMAATSYVEKIKSLCNHLPDANRQLAEAVLFLASCADGYKSIDAASLQKLKDLIGGQEYIDNYDVSKAPDIDLNSRVSLDTSEQSGDDGNSSTKSPGGNTNSGGSSGGRSYSGGTSGGYSGGTSGGYSGGAAGVAAAAASPTTKEEKPEEKEAEKELEIDSLEKGEHAELPASLEQDGYKNNAYDKDNKFKTGSNEESVEALWKSQGSNYEDSIATIKVNDEQRYLVKVSPKYGQVGDSIDVNLKDGSVVKCVIAENKTMTGSDANAYGSVGKDGKVNILEFETKTLQESETINYQWDEKSPVTVISNNGSILNNQAEATKIIENKTYPVPEATLMNNTTSSENVSNIFEETSTEIGNVSGVEGSSSNIVTSADTTSTTTFTTNADNTTVISPDTTKTVDNISTNIESHEG